MESYPVDIDPGQVVRWVMAERSAMPTRLVAEVRRTPGVGDIPLREDYRLGDEEREDISEATVTAVLEVTPVHVAEGWRLTVTVEEDATDEPVSETDPTEGGADDGEETIDIDAFYRDFIEPRRGNIEVTAEFEGPEAEARLAEIIDAIGRNAPHPC